MEVPEIARSARMAIGLDDFAYRVLISCLFE